VSSGLFAHHDFPRSRPGATDVLALTEAGMRMTKALSMNGLRIGKGRIMRVPGEP
jgi:hypothetical protein